MPAELMLVADAPGFHDDRLGRPLVGREITLLPLYHPAAALHNARLLPPLEADVARLGELLGRASVARPPAARPSAGDAAVTEADEQQLGLF
jgi:uracil-DNA glycosylase